MSDDYLDIDPTNGRPKTSGNKAYPLETVDEVHDWHNSCGYARQVKRRKT